MEGWLKLSRKIISHWIWKDPIKLKWWLDILLTVNWEDNKVAIGYKVFECKRGQSLLSLQSWAKRWNVSKSVVNNFFNMLEGDGMITVENETVTTRITVCNYESYQQVQNANETERERIENASRTQQSTIEERKEYKEYKKLLLSEINLSDFPAINSNYFEIAKSFQLLFRSNLIESGTATTVIDKAKGKWIDDVRLMIESDKYTIDDLRAAYSFLQKDAFWKQNILSISKLREKMPQLKLKIHNSNGNSRTNSKEATSWTDLADVVATAFSEGQ